MKALLKSRKVREITIRKGMRLGEVARAAGVSAVQFSKVLAGAHELRPHARERLCEVLNASFDDLFEVRES